MTDQIKTFFASWGMTDADTRLAAIKDSLTAEARYADPRTEAPLIGPEAIADYVGMFSTHAPGAVAEVSNAETRDGVIRATVDFKMPNGMAQQGQYFAETNASGQISRLVGFVGTGAAE